MNGILLMLWLAQPRARTAEPLARMKAERPVAMQVDGKATAAGESAIMTAAEAEMKRAMAGLRLPDQPPPYLVKVEALDGNVATASASFGVLTSYDAGPYRTLRSEVRVGSYALDNSNFAGPYGDDAGVDSRGLPEDDEVIALQREMWLSLDHAYKGAAETYSAKLSARQGDTTEHPPDLSKESPLVTRPLSPRPVDGVLIQNLVQALSRVGRDVPGIESSDAVARDWQGVRLICSSEGTRAWLPTGYTVVRVEIDARAGDGARIVDERSWVVSSPDHLPSLDQMKAAVRDMASWVQAMIQAPVEQDYLGPVLFEQPAAVELFRQLVAADISGTPPVEDPSEDPSNQRTVPTARIGRRLLPLGWSVVDDPRAIPGAAGAYDYDFEGVAAQRVHAVVDGVVRNLLMSRVPRKDIHHSNGHGRSLGTDRRVGMPAVVEVEPRKSVSSRRLRKRALQLARQAGLDYVLVVRRMEPPALSSDFQIAFSGDAPLSGLTRPLEAYRLYPDGREQPVRGLSFVGVDRRSLRDIDSAGHPGDPVGVLDTAAGPDRYTIGPVGGLPATWVVPPVVITELELRGHGGHETRLLPPPPNTAKTTARPSRAPTAQLIAPNPSEAASPDPPRTDLARRVAPASPASPPPPLGH